MVTACVSKNAVSRICPALDVKVTELRSRQLPAMHFPYLRINATYMPSRKDSHDATFAAVTTIAIGKDGTPRR